MVYLLIILHTRSVFLGSLGMLQVLLSFPLAYFLFRVILNQAELNMMVVLSIFIILGIGAGR